MVMGMASHIKKGESLLIPFRNGQSISDSQLKPRMYKTMQAFEKAFPKHYLGTDGVEIAEYAEVVRCKDCKHYHQYHVGKTNELCEWGKCQLISMDVDMPENGFCSYGERREGE